jgi:hypothetical protein
LAVESLPAVFWTDFLEQSSAVYWASSLAAAALAALLLVADGEALDEAVALGLADEVAAAFRASLAARP